MLNSYTISAVKLNQFAFLRAFGRRSSPQTEPPTECFFNSMRKEYVKRYGCKYIIYEDGKVLSTDWKRTGKSIFMSESNKVGYKSYNLCKNGKGRHEFLHRLLAEAFIPNPENKPQVNHINGIKTDNRLENLEWATAKENMNHARSTGLIDIEKIKYGQEKNRWKLMRKVGRYNIDGELLEECCSVTEAAKKIKGSRGNICSCLKGKQKTSYGFLWKYL